MSHYEKIQNLINLLIEQSGNRYEKPKLMKLLLEIDYLKDDTLTNIMRNDIKLRTEYKKTDCTSGYPTVAGELLLNYFNDDFELDLFALTFEDKKSLIQQIITKFNS